MRAIPAISLSAATGLVDAISAEGADVDLVLRSCGQHRQDIANPHGRIACAVFARLLDRAAAATGDAYFGLHFGERYNPKNIGPIVYLALNSPTFAAAFENWARYLHAHNESARMSVENERGRAYLRHELIDRSIEAPRQHNEYSLAMGQNVIRLMAGSLWAPVEVQFSHQAPADVSEHTRVFGAPVAFGCATNAFVIDQELLDRPVPAADPRLYPVLKRYLDQVLIEMPREEGLLHAVRRAVGESMREGNPTLARVARKTAMSGRTLQRRLREQGVDFEWLVDDTRRRFALSYLRDRRLTVTEIACLVGYSEVSAFNRAFRRWMGTPPLDYRRKMTRGSES